MASENVVVNATCPRNDLLQQWLVANGEPESAVLARQGGRISVTISDDAGSIERVSIGRKPRRAAKAKAKGAAKGRAKGAATGGRKKAATGRKKTAGTRKAGRRGGR